MAEYVEFRVRVPEALIEALSGEFSLSKGRAAELIRKKDIRLNGAKYGSDSNEGSGMDYILKAGDILGVYLRNEESARIKAEIVYSDDNIAVAVKPPGVESSGLHSMEGRVERAVMKPARACHRLDYNTSGLNVFALSDAGYKSMTECFRERRVEKTYLAEVVGDVKSHDVVKGYLFKDSVKKKVYVYSEKRKGSVYAETEYRLAGSTGRADVIEIRIHSGRTHQIRAMLAGVGVYIVGDGKYGDYKINEEYGEKIQRLYAVRLRFRFPKESEMYYLDGAEMKYVPEKLKTYLK